MRASDDPVLGRESFQLILVFIASADVAADKRAEVARGRLRCTDTPKAAVARRWSRDSANFRHLSGLPSTSTAHHCLAFRRLLGKPWMPSVPNSP
ncbi:hypothetical protein PR202_ga24042 [Eleusine coracana subsp. coracana]|uniref:Uncharacterized protein n=1 Tax=Eleusine coracana subsp. coracana TaxID=191504 RepID=A0AAV5D832_ELECO|nr:hypothetical protein PR202_ga24042 [Eleusine coracana subsp. coracana]